MNLGQKRKAARKLFRQMQQRSDERRARVKAILNPGTTSAALGPKVKKPKSVKTPMHIRRKKALKDRKIVVGHRCAIKSGKFVLKAIREPRGEEDLKILFAGLPNLGEEDPLFNVKLEKQSAFSSSRGFMAALEKKGYERIGHGAYSGVFAKKNSDRVIKVGHKPDSDGWVDYMLWSAGKGYAGTLAPKVFSYKKIHIKGKTKESFYLAVMERLDKTVTELDGKHDMKYIELFLHYGAKNAMMQKLADVAVPGLGQFTLDLNDLKGYKDLHGGNIMVRKDGSFVVSDPISRSVVEPINKPTRFKPRVTQTLGLAA